MGRPMSNHLLKRLGIPSLACILAFCFSLPGTAYAGRRFCIEHYSPNQGGVLVKASPISLEHLLLRPEFLRPSNCGAMVESWTANKNSKPVVSLSTSQIQADTHIQSKEKSQRSIGKIEKRKPPVTIKFGFNLLPNNNIGGASSKEYFDTKWGRLTIENGGEEKSEIGMEASVHASFQAPFEFGKQLELGSNLSRVWFRQNSSRYWLKEMSAGIRNARPNSETAASLYTTSIMYDATNQKAANRQSIGLQVSSSKLLSHTSRFELATLAEFREFPENQNMSGPYIKGNVTWSKMISPAFQFSAGTTINRSKPSLEYHRFWGIGFAVSLKARPNKNQLVGLDLSASQRAYDTNFILVDYNRRDTLFRIGSHVTDNRLSFLGKHPKLSCGFELQKSNISLYSKEVTDCRISLSLDF